MGDFTIYNPEMPNKLLPLILLIFVTLAQGQIRPKTSKYTIGPSIQPLVIIGEGWSQQFVFVNCDYYGGGDHTVGKFSFFTQDGKPWSIPLIGRGSVSEIAIDLRPGQMLMFETEVSFAPQKLGWAAFELVSDINQWGIYSTYTVFRKQQDGRPDLITSVPFVDGLEDEWIIPFDNAGGKYPGIALVNTSTGSTARLFLIVTDISGIELKTISKSVAPRSLVWFSLLGENPDLVNRRGQIKVTGGFFSSAVFSLQFTPNGAFTAIPMVHTYGMQ
jgi:hypothetical protein